MKIPLYVFFLTQSVGIPNWWKLSSTFAWGLIHHFNITRIHFSGNNLNRIITKICAGFFCDIWICHVKNILRRLCYCINDRIYIPFQHSSTRWRSHIYQLQTHSFVPKTQYPVERNLKKNCMIIMIQINYTALCSQLFE